ncbi:MAG: LytTR family DNA-binding domain-containing protein [Cyclobacteriaceae bacterium]|jgi:two-component system LytT family response regulator|nr:LytTR family DNA-binding domain-containing protein [Cytophagales bacterium]MCZ8328901.1 LytTR family DNA-binding domain-containing protein [Cyclobacteriaceae bacterium]
MMFKNMVIIEDENPAVEKLQRYLLRYNSDVKILAVLNTVPAAIEWLEENQSLADVIFMDIQLHDKHSFEIIDKVKIVKPIIFVTAYNDYALQAFKAKALDYLLKPITYADLETSLKKLESFAQQFQTDTALQTKLKETLSHSTKEFKNRFMVKVGDRIKSITTDEIALFYADGRDVYLVNKEARKFIVDYTVEQLEELVDPTIFFRINRSYLLNINAIQEVNVHSNSRLKIKTHIQWTDEIIVSREKVADFKKFFDGNV